MPRETDLLRVKLVAHTLLDAQIQETALSPVIVSHPFTNSGISALRNEDGSLSMVDLINNSDDCTRWRRKVGEQIDSAENVHQIFVLLNPPYYLTFIKFAASDLSEKDLGQLLWYNGRDGSNVHYHASRYHALNLHSVFQKGTVEFRMFNSTLHAGKVKTYIQFSLAIANQALTQRNARAAPTRTTNDRYTFRTWLLRLGMIGPEFETARFHLLSHLEGNIAWRDPSQLIREQEEQTQHAPAQEPVPAPGLSL